MNEILMLDRPDVYPIPVHPTWGVVDSSKLNTAMRCFRRYFYEYVLGWRLTGAKHDLIFGEAWHRGIEVLLVYGYSKQAVDLAQFRFFKYYRQFYDEMSDDIYSPKTPGAALVALAKYAKDMGSHDEKDFKVLYTEISLQVPIIHLPSGQVINITGRMDGICREIVSNKIFFMEHKTTKRAGRQWMDQWELAIQLGTYTHFLYAVYGPENVRGGLVNGAAFRKDDIEFIRVPIWKNEDKMNIWHSTVSFWTNLLLQQFEILQECKASDRVMEAFPMNPNACTDFFGCPYHDLCTSWPNPLRRCDRVPVDYELDFWDPMARESTTVADCTQEKPVLVKRKLTI